MAMLAEGRIHGDEIGRQPLRGEAFPDEDAESAVNRAFSAY